MKKPDGGLYLGVRAPSARGEKTLPLFYKKDRHVLIAGANGTGKTKRLGVPNLLQSQGRSWLVIDPKGALARLTASARRRFGEVVLLDPFNVAGMGSTGFNPLALLDPASSSFNADAGLIAQALITVDGREMSYWPKAARVLVSWLIMHEVETARAKGQVPWLGNVRTSLGAREAANPAPSGIVKDAFAACKSQIEALRNKAGQYTNLDKEVTGILNTAREQTEFLDDVEIAKDLEGPYTFADFKRHPVTVYLTLPANMLERQKSWLRMAISSALRVCLLDPENLGVPAVFFLDEFAALGRLEVIERNLPLVREYGIQFMPVVQGFSQLEELYGKGWQKFIGNAGAVCCFAPGDDLTAKWMSDNVGERLAMMPGYNLGQDPQGKPSSGVSYSFQRVPAITPNELRGLPDGRLLVFLAGLSSVVVADAPWWEDVPQWRQAAGR